MGANSSTLGRPDQAGVFDWMTPDPLAGDISNPQSLNRYAYALNNPTTLIDPLGLDSIGLNVLNCGHGVTIPQGQNPKVYCYQHLGIAGGSSPGAFFSNNVDEFGLIAPAGFSGGGNGDPGTFSEGFDPNGAMLVNLLSDSALSHGYAVTPLPLKYFPFLTHDQLVAQLKLIFQPPNVCGGGGFAFAGAQFQVPKTKLKGEALIVANYDSGKGFSLGGLLEFFGLGGELAYNFKAKSAEGEGLGFLGHETASGKVGVVGVGALAATNGTNSGALGLYGEIDGVGGGGYANLSFGGCQE